MHATAALNAPSAVPCRTVPRAEPAGRGATPSTCRLSPAALAWWPSHPAAAELHAGPGSRGRGAAVCWSSRQDAARRAKQMGEEDERPNAYKVGPFPVRDASEDGAQDFSGRDTGDSQALALALAAAAHEVKCVDIQVLAVGDVITWARFFVVATAFSKPQVNAALGMVLDAAAKEGRKLDLEPAVSGWVCCDFGDVVAHIFTPQDREFYNLSGLYGKAKRVPLGFESAKGAGDIA